MIEPIYNEDGITLYNADCTDVLPLLSAVDLVLTDPPYGIFKNIDASGVMFGKKTIYSSDKTATEWDVKPSNELLHSLMTAGRYYTIWGGNYFADALGASKGTLVWDKQTGNNTYADGELAFTNSVGTMRIFHHQWCGAFKDSERGQRAIHPTQKPVALMEWCINLTDAKRILDPFAGSGTSLVAAKRLGREAIGVEISERYCQIAIDRLRQKELF